MAVRARAHGGRNRFFYGVALRPSAQAAVASPVSVLKEQLGASVKTLAAQQQG